MYAPTTTTNPRPSKPELLRRFAGHPDQAYAPHQESSPSPRTNGYGLEDARAFEGIGRAAADIGNIASAAS